MRLALDSLCPSPLRALLADSSPSATPQTSAAEKKEDKPLAPKAARRLSTRITGLFKGHKESKPAAPAADKVSEEAPKVRPPLLALWPFPPTPAGKKHAR